MTLNLVRRPLIAVDLELSNPDAVKLYKMSLRQYVAAVGCNH